MNLPRLTIRARVIASAVIGGIAIAAIGAASLWREREMAEALREVYEVQVRPMQELQRIDSTLKDVRFRLAGVLLDQMPVPGSRNHLKAASQEVPQLWASYKASQGDAADASQAELRDKIEKGVATATGFMTRLDAAYAKGDKAALTAMLEDEWPVVQGSLVKHLEQLLPIAAESVKATYEGHRAASQRKAAVVLPVLLAVLGGFGLVAWWYLRTLSRGLDSTAKAVAELAAGNLAVRLPDRGADEIDRFARAFNASMDRLSQSLAEIRERAEAIDGASGEIAQGNADLSGRTEMQASSLQQTAASTEELTSTVRQNHERAADAARLAGESAQRAQAAGDVVERAISTMSEIDASSKRIEQITGVIDGIAFQTNILALNAAVEAARAGDAGRGFAVVASEVRTLAQRSATASKEIRELIAASVTHVDDGGRLVASLGAAMSDVVRSVHDVSTLVTEISHASQEQASGIEQISRAVSQMDAGTQQNSALVEEAAAASESLRAQAAALREIVDRFRTRQAAHAG
jgi:methyl-accepting chemotaxis protein